MIWIHKRTWVLVLAVLTGITGQAQFAYNSTKHDLLLNFRKNGKSDLIVDIGPALKYSKKDGISFEISQLTSANLISDADYVDLNDIKWSVSGYVVSGTGTSNEIDGTIWATKKDFVPFVRAIASIQNIPGQNMKAVGDAANAYGISISETACLQKTVSAVNYTKKIGLGNYGGNQLNAGVEADTGSWVSETSVLYLHEMLPGSGPGDYLGYFAFSSDGTITFTSAGGTQPQSIISVLPMTVNTDFVGATNVLFNLSLSKAASAPVTISYHTLDGTALAGTDYITNYGTIIFPPGATNADLSLTVTAHDGMKAEQYFLIQMSNPVNAALSTNQVRCTLLHSLPLERPQVSISRTNNENTLSFSSIAGVTYWLSATNSAGLSSPVAVWPKLDGTITGDGNVLHFTDTPSTSQIFYSVGAVR